MIFCSRLVDAQIGLSTVASGGEVCQRRESDVSAAAGSRADGGAFFEVALSVGLGFSVDVADRRGPAVLLVLECDESVLGSDRGRRKRHTVNVHPDDILVDLWKQERAADA